MLTSEIQLTEWLKWLELSADTGRRAYRKVYGDHLLGCVPLEHSEVFASVVNKLW